MDALVVVGLIAALFLAGVLTLGRWTRGASGRQAEALWPENTRCVCCGTHTIYQASVCPSCKHELEADRAQRERQ